jgi:hypothetical protein
LTLLQQKFEMRPGWGANSIFQAIFQHFPSSFFIGSLRPELRNEPQFQHLRASPFPVDARLKASRLRR